MTSVLCPTRRRPRLLVALVASADDTALHPPEFVLYVDDDDELTPPAVATLRAAGHDVVAATGPCITMSDMWNRCAELATHDTLLFCDDEALFHTVRWDVKLAAGLETYPDHAALVQPNDTVHGDLCAGYFAVHRTWLSIFGRLTPPMFTYGYADVWALEVAQAAGRRVYLPDVVIENTAPRNQPPDEVHEENARRAERDRPGALYLATQPEREAEVARLRAYVTEHATVTR